MDKGTVNEGVLREKFPGAKVIAYDDTPFAFTALRNGQVQAITQDGPKLIGLLANVPDRDKYEVPPFTISNDLIGVGIPKGEKALTEFVDKSLRELEQDGQAQKIYDTWFGPQTKTRWRACTRSATRAERPASPARPARLTSLRRVFVLPDGIPHMFGELLAPQYLRWLLDGFLLTLGLALLSCLLATLIGAPWPSPGCRAGACCPGRRAPAWRCSAIPRCWCSCSSGTSAFPRCCRRRW